MRQHGYRRANFPLRKVYEPTRFPLTIHFDACLGDVSLSQNAHSVHRSKETFRARKCNVLPFGHALEKNGVYRGECECVISSRLNSRPVNVAESHAQIVPRSEMEVIAGSQRCAVSPHAGSVRNE
jgi:hypothetical protein